MKPAQTVEQRHADLGDFAPPEGEIAQSHSDVIADNDPVNDTAVERDNDPMEPAKPPYGDDADLPPKPGNPEEHKRGAVRN